MTRIKIDLPEIFSFSCDIPVRITDINYGGHVGNDTILSIVQEARMQFFNLYGYTELDFAGTGTIMADVAIEFKNELFYGDVVIASVAIGEISKIGFDLFYKLEKQSSEIKILVAAAKTAIVCYDYENKKVVAIPEEAKKKLVE
jgi:acyl-CoA thioesterase FadM